MNEKELTAEEFSNLLRSCGFQRTKSWYMKKIYGVGALYAIAFGPVGNYNACHIQHGLMSAENVVELKMPKTEQQFRRLCASLKVRLDELTVPPT